MASQALSIVGTASDKAVEVYGTASDKAIELYGVATAKYPWIQQVERDEAVLIAVTVLPVICAFFAILGQVFRCCCAPKSTKIAPSPASAGKNGAKKAPPSPPAKKGGTPTKGGSPPKGSAAKGGAKSPAAAAQPPPLQTRPSVLVRGSKDKPDSSIGHATRGQDVKKGKKTPAKQGAYMA